MSRPLEILHADDDLLVGFQLTHSGRFCRPNPGSAAEPQILYQGKVIHDFSQTKKKAWYQRQ